MQPVSASTSTRTGTSPARNAALAEAVLSGQGVAEALDAQPVVDQGVSNAPMTPSEARRVVSGLETLLAQALDEHNQASSAVRRASIKELKALLEAEKRAFDALALGLMHQWVRTTELMAKVGGVTGMAQYDFTWASMKLPRAIPPKNLTPFQDGSLWCDGVESMRTSSFANLARAEIAQLLKSKGIS